MIDWLPPGMDVPAAAVLVFASFFTSLLTASFGIGGGLALLTIMTYLVPVAALIPVHGAIQFGSNAGRAFLQRKYISWHDLLAFLAGGVVGAAIGSQVLITLPENLLQTILGAFVILITWLKLPHMRQMGRVQFAATGAVTTFLSLFLGATAPLNVAAFEKTFPDRNIMVATLASLMTLQHVLKVLAFGLAGFAFFPWVPLIAVTIATGFVGTAVGLSVLGRIREETFRHVLKIILTIVGLDMIRRGLLG